ncbi:MAG: triose-phosphate isomerase [Crocinitomicaceae bacterium]|nr:triose-phosphate isomerase [Crocinitomicaceae bacterium]
MPQKIVAGNWKMNLCLDEGVDLIRSIEASSLPSDVKVMVFPPALFVDAEKKTSSSKCLVGVQNFNAAEKGAFTGEVSIKQVKSAGASIGLIGHSERRELFNETNAILKDKVDAAIENNFQFIFCCGEPLEVREAGTEIEFVRNQLEESLFHLASDQMRDGIIAYEPIWAIGTGRTASSEQAEDMHREIRAMLSEKYTNDIAESISILYGGSCKSANAKELFACPNVNGGLIGGAALDATSFCAIIDSF